jgi:hypothetical protein
MINAFLVTHFFYTITHASKEINYRGEKILCHEKEH